MRMFLITVLVEQEYTFVKTLQTLLLRSIYFIECKLYLKKWLFLEALRKLD